MDPLGADGAQVAQFVAEVEDVDELLPAGQRAELDGDGLQRENLSELWVPAAVKTSNS